MIFGTYFYNETIKRCVSVFGTLFNNIQIKKTKADGTVLTTTMVLNFIWLHTKSFYKDWQKDLQDKSRSAISLPRMAFQLEGFNYDSQRQQNKLIRHQKTVTESNSSDRKFQYRHMI